MAEDEKLSKFNAAQLKILNLNNIWVSCRSYREVGQLEKVRWALDSAKVELSVDIKKQKRLDELKKIDKKINNSIGRDLYVALLEKEELLREVEDKAGKGIIYHDPDEDDMD